VASVLDGRRRREMDAARSASRCVRVARGASAMRALPSRGLGGAAVVSSRGSHRRGGGVAGLGVDAEPPREPKTLTLNA